MKTAHYLVQTTVLCFTFIGQAQPDGAHDWLCTPDGRRMLRVPREHVHPSTLEETAARLVADRRAALASRN